MNSNEVYKRFLLKNNTNDTNEGTNILVSHFVLLFNSEALRWESEKLNKDGDNVNLDDLDRLLVSNLSLDLVKRFDDSVDFQLPEDFYRQASSFSIVDKGNCTGVKIFNFEKKALGFTALADAFSKPNFDLEETPVIITDNKLKVYFDDFKIQKVYLTYYKTPTEIDIAGYSKIDGEPSEDIDTELSDNNIDEILSRLVLEVKRQQKDNEGFQYSKERIQEEK